MFNNDNKPSLLESLSPVIIVLVLFIVGGFFDIDSISIMLVSTFYIGICGALRGLSWREMELAVGEKIKTSASAMSILLCVGIMIGSWVFSGTIPMCIYYGIKLISNQYILASSFLISAFFSLVTGSSMSTCGTAGVILMGIASNTSNVNLAMVAGACYTGAIFGDKLSPLSDTTILASVVTENDIFEHIQQLAKTVLPAAVVSLSFYFFHGLFLSSNTKVYSQSSLSLLNSIETIFRWNYILCLPILIVILGAILKKPVVVTMIISTFSAITLGVAFQRFKLNAAIKIFYNGFNLEEIIYDMPYLETEATEIISLLTPLLNRGGLVSMLKPFMLCYICFYFAAIFQKCGYLKAILETSLSRIKSRSALMVYTSFITMLMVVVGGSSTVAIIMVGELFKGKYKEFDISSLTLSRILEDFGTGTSAFFPWTSSGIYYPIILGISNFEMFKYSYMSYICWGISLFYAASGFCIKRNSIMDKADIL